MNLHYTGLGSYIFAGGGGKNVELAIRYLEGVSRRGNQYAQLCPWQGVYDGKEVEQDKEKAYEYFRLAAEQGNVYAVYFWNTGMICPIRIYFT